MRNDEAQANRSASFFAGMLSAVAVGLAVRLGYALTVVRSRWLPWDGQYNHDVANGFVAGQGWIDQSVLQLRGVSQPTAYFAPLYGGVLALSSWLGADSVRAHRILTCFIGVTSVIVAAFLGRMIGGAAVGVVAAFLAALQPLLIGADGTLMTESLYIPLAGLAVLLTYRMLRTPTLRNAAWFGLVLALTALTRGEGLGLAMVLGVPLLFALHRRGLRWLKYAAVIVGVMVLTISPWTIRNAVTFERPVLIATDYGTVLAGSYCQNSFYGPNAGGWSGRECPDVPDPVGDESVINSQRARMAASYARHHVTAMFRVVPLRIMGTWLPPLNARHEIVEVWEGRDRDWQRTGDVLYLLSIPFAVLGIVTLRRRGIAVWPLLAPCALVTAVSAATYGIQRFRAAAELPIVALAAVGLVISATKLKARFTGATSAGFVSATT